MDSSSPNPSLLAQLTRERKGDISAFTTRLAALEETIEQAQHVQENEDEHASESLEDTLHALSSSYHELHHEFSRIRSS